MIQAPPEPRELMDEIVARLISKFQPRRIYLFGSRARGDAQRDSDYDFLIEIDKKPEGIVITRQGMTWLEDFPETEVQVHLRAPDELERRKDDPGTIDWDVAREGRLLFTLDGLPAIEPGPNRNLVRERSDDLPRIRTRSSTFSINSASWDLISAISTLMPDSFPRLRST